VLPPTCADSGRILEPDQFFDFLSSPKGQEFPEINSSWTNQGQISYKSRGRDETKIQKKLVK